MIEYIACFSAGIATGMLISSAILKYAKNNIGKEERRTDD